MNKKIDFDTVKYIVNFVHNIKSKFPSLKHGFIALKNTIKQ